MHKTQQALLRLSKERNLASLSLREIGELIGIKSPQIIKHHIEQLKSKDLLDKDRSPIAMNIQEPASTSGLLKKAARLFILPILGWANAGPAGVVAEENIMGYFRVSSTLLKRKSKKGLFVLEVQGPSMNLAKIDGKTIESGDYIIVDGKKRSPDNGDIVLSVIDGMANIKRFNFDKKNKQVVLTSESTKYFPPIFIHPNDSYMVNGKVVQIIKKPK